MKNLFYVPRFRGHTIIHPVKAKYGAVRVYAYPVSSGRGGIRASPLMASICKLAGLENIGVKVCPLCSFWQLAARACTVLRFHTCSRVGRGISYQSLPHLAVIRCAFIVTDTWIAVRTQCSEGAVHRV
jgi:hypothetical protein